MWLRLGINLPPLESHTPLRPIPISGSSSKILIQSSSSARPMIALSIHATSFILEILSSRRTSSPRGGKRSTA